MIILGISSTQSRILKGLKLGQTHNELSDELGLTLEEVMLEEMRAMAKLSRRWKLDDVSVRKLLGICFFITLSLMPTFYDMEMVRTVRAKTSQSRTSKSRGKKDFDFLET